MVRGSVVVVMVAVMVLAVAGQSSVLASPPCNERACPAVLDLVCGSDGRTYPSPCHFAIAKCKNKSLRFRHKGKCAPQPECHRFCTLQYDPVCGSDGKTYGNACQLSVEAICNNKPGLHAVRKGPCYTTDKKQ